jgi:transcriptional regulator with XRE-family HTH domain
MPKITIDVPLEVTGLPVRLRAAMKDVATASKLKRITQEQLEAVSGVAQSSISRLLNEKRAGGGHIAHAFLLARALGVRPAWLITGEEPMRAANAVVPVFPKIIDADAESAPDVRVRSEHDKNQFPRP